ncbi:hypothetical protein [Methanococcoides sp. FTZ1]|uniref:hypothetical protein n=1 Tax=Methanococcoides sp. FTZ1 TaxID=3439061 RepID=UPI003F871D0A
MDDSAFELDIYFAPWFSIPLENTQLKITLPYDIDSVEPEPLSMKPTLHWDQAPSNVVVTGTQKKGNWLVYGVVLVILAGIGYMVYRKRGMQIDTEGLNAWKDKGSEAFGEMMSKAKGMRDKKK